MPKRPDLKRICILGAGPIIIGQACEFDYSGSQACRALMAEGYEVILINSNPATIMTDPELATRTYIEPMTAASVSQVLEKERPDALLPTMGGQTALNLAFELAGNGTLEKLGVELIGANLAAIEVAEDRDRFKTLMTEIGLDSLTSKTITSLNEAEAVAAELGYPLIIRPAFTLGGSGGSIVYNASELVDRVTHGLELSPISQILMEESALGWKEYEFEVMRDAQDNVVIVCSVENFDPMGVHTGDSITVAPAQTLTDREYQALRDASIRIIRAVGVEAGGCNIQFAIHPKTGRVIVIEMNPRVSRSSALVSKATGVPIAKISARLAVGYSLDEIANDITRTTPACFEPAIDYVVTKIPRFSFDKFPEGGQALSPQMKSVGEVMAIGRTFAESFQKALRGLEMKQDGFAFPRKETPLTELETRLKYPAADRLRWVYQALAQNIDTSTLFAWTGIDPWFLENLREMVTLETRLQQETLETLPTSLLVTAKQKGFSDAQLALLLKASEQAVAQKRQNLGLYAVYKSVDTCAGEFEAYTPYFYSTYECLSSNETTVTLSENEAPEAVSTGQANKRVVILGGGPNRIGQGIEFDYCCVHAAKALQALGYEAIMVNSNPETVSTDYDTSNRLYFEPLTAEDVGNLLNQEQPLGVIAQLGGQTPLKLARQLKNHPHFKPLGTSVESIDAAEDREQFKAILEQLGLEAPASGIARTPQEALEVAVRLGYPVMVRPSYVLGGQAMRVVYSQASLQGYLETVFAVHTSTEGDMPVLIDRFLENALELDVDAVSDGKTTLVGAILEHIEYAGIHSGDSACVWPSQTLTERTKKQIETATHQLACALGVKGLLNIQFALKNNRLYVLEVNPRASRTVPFVCKASGQPLLQMALRVMLGESLADVLQSLKGTYPEPGSLNHVAVKAPVFPFIKFRDSDPKLGPEMRSTGEVMGVDTSFALAYSKALAGAGTQLPQTGTVFISVTDLDKPQALEVARFYRELGFEIMATSGTASFFERHGLKTRAVGKKHEAGHESAETLIAAGAIHLVINTPAGDAALADDSYIRKAAVIYNVPMTTTLSAAQAMAEAIEALRKTQPHVTALQDLYTTQKQPATA